MAKAATMIALAKRCGMTVYDLNTGVVRSDDGHARIMVSGAHNAVWGDHISIQWMPENTPGRWFYAHFSADKCELFARLLLARADALRKLDDK